MLKSQDDINERLNYIKKLIKTHFDSQYARIVYTIQHDFMTKTIRHFVLLNLCMNTCMHAYMYNYIETPLKARTQVRWRQRRVWQPQCGTGRDTVVNCSECACELQATHGE